MAMTSLEPDTEVDTDFSALLLAACHNGQVSTVQRLLLESRGRTLSAERPLLARKVVVACAENGSLECLRLLAREFPGGLNMDVVDEDGMPCLQLAVVGRYVEMVEYLLKCGADVNARDAEMHTAIHWAVVCQHHDLLTILLVNGGDAELQDERGASALHYAAQMCGKSLSRAGREETALLLLQHLLYVRVTSNCIDNDGRTPILWAANAGSSKACKMLVEEGASVHSTDKKGLSALHCAATRGFHHVIVTLVRDCMASVDAPDRHRCSPLFYAVNHCRDECVKTLLDLGANVNCTDSKGRSVAHYAAEFGNIQVVRLLLSAACNFWSCSSSGQLPIHGAIRRAKREVVLCLAQQLGKAHTSAIRGCLHLAASINDAEIIAHLLQLKANINAVAKYEDVYMTALDIALKNHHHRCAKYIRENGGTYGQKIIDASARKIQRALRRHKPRSSLAEGHLDTSHQRPAIQPERNSSENYEIELEVCLRETFIVSNDSEVIDTQPGANMEKKDIYESESSQKNPEVGILKMELAYIPEKLGASSGSPSESQSKDIASENQPLFNEQGCIFKQLDTEVSNPKPLDENIEQAESELSNLKAGPEQCPQVCHHQSPATEQVPNQDVTLVDAQLDTLEKDMLVTAKAVFLDNNNSLCVSESLEKLHEGQANLDNQQDISIFDQHIYQLPVGTEPHCCAQLEDEGDLTTKSRLGSTLQQQLPEVSGNASSESLFNDGSNPRMLPDDLTHSVDDGDFVKNEAEALQPESCGDDTAHLHTTAVEASPNVQGFDSNEQAQNSERTVSDPVQPTSCSSLRPSCNEEPHSSVATFKSAYDRQQSDNADNADNSENSECTSELDQSSGPVSSVSNSYGNGENVKEKGKDAQAACTPGDAKLTMLVKGQPTQVTSELDSCQTLLPKNVTENQRLHGEVHTTLISPGVAHYSTSSQGSLKVNHTHDTDRAFHIVTLRRQVSRDGELKNTNHANGDVLVDSVPVNATVDNDRTTAKQDLHKIHCKVMKLLKENTEQKEEPVQASKIGNSVHPTGAMVSSVNSDLFARKNPRNMYKAKPVTHSRDLSDSRLEVAEEAMKRVFEQPCLRNGSYSASLRCGTISASGNVSNADKIKLHADLSSSMDLQQSGLDVTTLREHNDSLLETLEQKPWSLSHSQTAPVGSIAIPWWNDHDATVLSGTGDFLLPEVSERPVQTAMSSEIQSQLPHGADTSESAAMSVQVTAIDLASRPPSWRPKTAGVRTRGQRVRPLTSWPLDGHPPCNPIDRLPAAASSHMPPAFEQLLSAPRRPKTATSTSSGQQSHGVASERLRSKVQGSVQKYEIMKRMATSYRRLLRARPHTSIVGIPSISCTTPSGQMIGDADLPLVHSCKEKTLPIDSQTHLFTKNIQRQAKTE